MILDYAYNKKERDLSISYVQENGQKGILTFNVDKFKSYGPSFNGPYRNWDGRRCDIKWVMDPDKFDIKTYMEEQLSENHKKKLLGKVAPALYTWDIEVVSDEFPEPSEAKYPIVTISVCSPNCDVRIFGTRDLGENGDEYLTRQFSKYMEKFSYFQKLNLPMPTIKYIKFNTEREMIEYFLTNIVSQVPVLAGWNSMLFDWQYLQNRCDLLGINLKISSFNGLTDYKNYTDLADNKVKLQIPRHTVVLDMMDVIATHDYVVMPIKEALSLDYIASESMGVNKIQYEGTLSDLYYNDYQKYVYYNAIDSVLVQCIDKRFKTLQNIYTQALYCKERIGATFSKIAVSEALVFNYFYENGIKVIPNRNKDVQRGELQGAYVRIPTPGKHKYVCCNDFASLYPSTIITCNLSFENFLGNNFTEEEIENFRKDPNYFVSVTGQVYKNDKDYAFKVIQSTLKSNRNTAKYLAKGLEAEVVYDIDQILAGNTVNIREYSQDKIKAISEIGFNVSNTNDLKNIQDLNEFRRKLKTEIEFYTSYEQAMKLLGNSMYGGSSHVSFFWFNMAMANDITGEARNIIHLMEHHIPEFIRKEWPYMTDIHKQLGITVNPEKAEKILRDSKEESFVKVIYGDSCEGSTLISTVNGNIKIEDLFNNSDIVYIDRDKEFAISDVIIKNYNGNKIIESPINYVIRHKTSKSKWEIIDNFGNKVIVTGDHSMIIWDNEMKIIKPSDMTIGMKLITVTGITEVVSVKNIGNFNNEYVYDIEVNTNNDNEHNFFGGNILIHNTDSVKADTVIRTDSGNKTIEELFNENYNNNLFHTHKGHELVSTSAKVLNWDENNKLNYGGVNYIMRHKVSKPKWKLKTKSGKEIIVTNDHSMIVFRNGQKLEVKPYDILPTDKILIVK